MPWLPHPHFAHAGALVPVGAAHRFAYGALGGDDAVDAGIIRQSENRRCEIVLLAVENEVGAELVRNKISAAPGFMIGNVVVMAGIPQVMQAMLEYVTPQLKTGATMLSQTVRADLREGDIGTELGAIAKAHAGVVIGSYPFMEDERRPNTHIVLRARDPRQLAAAKVAVEEMIARVRAVIG